MRKRRSVVPGTSRSAADAAQYAALMHRCGLTREAAVAVAQAVLEFSEGTYSLAIEVPPDWEERSAYREHALRGLRRALAIDLDANGLLPVALPTEVIRPGREPGELITVELVVPVRAAAGESTAVRIHRARAASRDHQPPGKPPRAGRAG
jgi:hypothetical protein